MIRSFRDKDTETLYRGHRVRGLKGFRLFSFSPPCKKPLLKFKRLSLNNAFFPECDDGGGANRLIGSRLRDHREVGINFICDEISPVCNETVTLSERKAPRWTARRD